MAKKYEFKQDKQGASFWSKLYLTQKQRRSILRFALYALVLLAASVVQDVILCRLQLFGATTDLVPCGIILICILEGAEKSSLFALAASFLHLFSGGMPGIYSPVILTVVAVCASIFRQAYLQKGFGATLLCAGIAMLLYALVNFGVGLFSGLTLPGRVFGVLLSVVMTLPAIVLLNPVCMSIEALGGETWKE